MDWAQPVKIPGAWVDVFGTAIVWLLSFMWFPGVEVGVRIRLCLLLLLRLGLEKMGCGCVCEGRLGNLQHLPSCFCYGLGTATGHKRPCSFSATYKLSSEKAELLNVDFFEIKPDLIHNRLQRTCCLLQLQKMLNPPSSAEGRCFMRAGMYNVESRVSAGLPEGFC